MFSGFAIRAKAVVECRLLVESRPARPQQTGTGNDADIRREDLDQRSSGKHRVTSFHAVQAFDELDHRANALKFQGFYGLGQSAGARTCWLGGSTVSLAGLWRFLSLAFSRRYRIFRLRCANLRRILAFSRSSFFRSCDKVSLLHQATQKPGSFEFFQIFPLADHRRVRLFED